MSSGSLLGIASGPAVTPRRWFGADRIAMALLIILPVLAYAVPALAGHPVMPNDDGDQNFPLRVLVGHQLAHGNLPLLNPYIWSGAPLLAGWNAGAAYPFTTLFAVLPATGAWVLNEVITYWTAGLGLYAFLRSRGARPMAAWLGATAFTAGGSFAIQVEHFGLVAGVSWIPLAMLALSRLAEVRTLRSRVGWATVLGSCGAMCVLAGEPRAIDDAAVILGGYALWLLVRCGRSYRGYLFAALGGTALAVALSAVQWLPGLHAVAESQRSAATYQLFSSGSLHVPWLPLLTVPILLGGSNSFGVPGFLSGYNMTELASYVGLLPLVGAVVLLGTLRWRRPLPEWLIWHVLAALGLLFALGGHTDLAPLLYHVPFFGSQRLQSRNVMITDLALAVLLGYWAEHWLSSGRRAIANRLGLIGLLPVAIAATFCLIGIISPATLAPLLGVPRATAQIRELQPFYFSFLGIAAITGAYLICGPLLRGRLRSGLLAGVLVADLGLFTCTVLVHLDPRPQGPHDSILAAADESAHEAPLRIPVSSIGRDGRFLVYGPDGVDSYDLGGVGITDLNVISKTYSMQGYSAIVDGQYADATGTHQAEGQGHNTVSLRVIGDGTLDQLSARYLLTLPRYLLSNSQVEESTPTTRTLHPGASTTWYLGQAFRLRSLSVPISAGRAQLGVVLPNGSTRWLAAGTQRLAAPTDVVGITARAVGGTARVSSPTAVTTGGQRLVADGALQQALSTHDWRFAGNVGGYSVFTNPSSTPPLSLQAAPGKSVAGASVHRRTGDVVMPTSATVASRNGVVVVRSVAAIPGWSATWQPADGSASRSLVVQQHGLVQAVSVPPGSGVLSWHYSPPGFGPAVWLSVVGLLALIVSVAYVASRGRLPATLRSRGGRRRRLSAEIQDC